MKWRRSWAAALLLVPLLTACGSPDSHRAPPAACCDRAPTLHRVRGRLLTEGGPPGTPALGEPGSVTAGGTVRRTVRTDARGRFRLWLPAGRYRLTGHSPRYGAGRYLCRAAGTLVVDGRTPGPVQVVCQLR